jgi:hypothetical protein
MHPALLLLLAATCLLLTGCPTDDDDVQIDDDDVQVDDDDSIDDDDQVDDDDQADDDSAPDDDDSGDPVTPPCISWGSPEVHSMVKDSDLNEISGLVASRRRDDLFWVLEDSPSPTVLTALDSDGHTLGTLSLEGVDNVDWEDLATGPCGAETCLFVGDFGDNDDQRDDVAILRVVEPDQAGEGWALSETPDVFPFSYAEGPRDAEALVVGPDGLPVVIDKVPGGRATLHRFTTMHAGAPTVLEELGSIVTGEEGAGLPALATAADLRPDGTRLLVRTYAELFEYALDGAGLDGAPVAKIEELPHGLELQGEAVAYSRDQRTIWHVSEGTNPTLFRVRCVE